MVTNSLPSCYRTTVPLPASRHVKSAVHRDIRICKIGSAHAPNRRRVPLDEWPSITLPACIKISELPPATLHRYGSAAVPVGSPIPSRLSAALALNQPPTSPGLSKEPICGPAKISSLLCARTRCVCCAPTRSFSRRGVPSSSSSRKGGEKWREVCTVERGQPLPRISHDWCSPWFFSIWQRFVMHDPSRNSDKLRGV